MRALALAFLAVASTAQALEPAERALLEKSIRAGELATVEAATGGLDALPLVSLDVELDPDARTLSGEARLDWPNRTGAPVTAIPVRLSANSGSDDGATVEWNDVRASIAGGPPKPLTVQQSSTTITWYALPEPVPPGARLVLTGRLSAKLSHISAGATDPMQAGMGAVFGGGSGGGDEYGTFACGDAICTATGFAPEIPAFIDGKFDADEPSGIGDATYSDPVNVLLSVVAPSGAMVAATGTEVGKLAAGNGHRRTSFALAAAREAGFVVSRGFVVSEKTVNGVVVRSFAKATDKSAGAKALKAAAGALEVFDKELGKYPWATLNIAESALVGGAGGVELPALALGASGFYRRPDGMFAMADPSGTFFADTLAFITRHEVAHQWWHAQVGSHSQRDPYIDEPLAQWSALVATRKTEGAAAAKRARDTQIAVNFQALPLMGMHDGVVARPAGSFSSMLEYAGLVYGKAPLFYEAVERAAGQEALAAGLRAVVAKGRFHRITPAELKATLAASCGGKGGVVSRLWTRWFEEAHGDEDVGPLDLATFAGAVGGMQGLGAGGLGALQGLQGLMGGLQQGGQQNGLDAKALNKMMKELMQQLDQPEGDDE